MIRRFSFKNYQKKNQAINKYNNILVAGELNIDVSVSKDHFSELIDTFDLTNLFKTPTYFKTTRGTL